MFSGGILYKHIFVIPEAKNAFAFINILNKYIFRMNLYLFLYTNLPNNTLFIFDNSKTVERVVLTVLNEKVDKYF